MATLMLVLNIHVVAGVIRALELVGVDHGDIGVGVFVVHVGLGKIK